MSWITPVTSRTSAVQYTQDDLNRVGEDVQYLADLLSGYGYSVSVTAKTDWAVGGRPRAAQWAQYIANVQALVDSYYAFVDTPTLPAAADRLTYAEANAIERILADIDALIGWMQRSYRKSGVLKCGVNAAHLPLQRSVT